MQPSPCTIAIEAVEASTGEFQARLAFALNPESTAEAVLQSARLELTRQGLNVVPGAAADLLWGGEALQRSAVLPEGARDDSALPLLFVAPFGGKLAHHTAAAEPGLTDTGAGLCFEHLSESEARFIFNEVFVQDAYRLAALPSCAVVIDAGANIGLTTLACLRHIGPDARIVAVEPAPSIFAVLERNVAAYSEVVCVRCALGRTTVVESKVWVSAETPGESTRHVGERDERLRVLGRNESAARMEPVICRVDTISEIMRKQGLEDRVDLLKLDVEGDELEALQGVDDVHWPSIQRVSVEVYDVDGRLEAVCALLRKQAHFDYVWSEPQRSSCSVIGGSKFLSFVPLELKLFMVHAERSPESPRGVR